jgi:prepilin-type N-terminal cleavage/methylation domain-containing protein
MKRRKGFTLIELMVVVLIVGILAAVAIPILRSRIDAAKWTEGKASMGTIATAMRAWAAEKGMGAAAPVGGQGGIIGVADDASLGFAQEDLGGTYFTYEDFVLMNVSMPAEAGDVLTFTVRCTAGVGPAESPPSTPALMYYVEDGDASTDPFTGTAPGG